VTTSAQAVTYSVNDGLATIRMGREHGNAINGALVEGLTDAFLRARDDVEVKGALLASAGKIFCPGLDLQDLVSLDRGAMESLMGRFNACLLELYTFPKPMVAAISGHALAGGYILALTADWRIVKRGAMVGLNEIKVGVPFPYGVALILKDMVPRPRLEEVVLMGRNFTDEETVAAGLVHEVQDADGFEERCLSRLSDLASRDRRAFATTKRYLRSATAEKMAAGDALHVAEFLDGWFSQETRARIAEIVAGLKSRSA